MDTISIEQALSAARAVRAQWPECRVDFTVYLRPDRGDRTDQIAVETDDAEERRSIGKAAAWALQSVHEDGPRASLSGDIAGVPAYLRVPAVKVEFDADVDITCDADGTTETVGVVVTAFVVFEGLAKPAARMTRLLYVERGRDHLGDVEMYDKARRASCLPYSSSHRSQLLDLEAIAIAQAKVTALALEPARA